MLIKEQGDVASSEIASSSEEIIYRIEIPANRYDLLSLEGLVNGILVFLNKRESPRYKRISSKDPDLTKLTVTSNPAKIRPYVVGAILRNVSFNKDRYNNFIDLQDKLHQNICRKRTIVAIWTRYRAHLFMMQNRQRIFGLYLSIKTKRWMAKN
jgi:phenylalanyl-tRNA synthetase beta chain